MKYSTAIAIALAPMALAKSARRSRSDIKRTNHLVEPAAQPAGYEAGWEGEKPAGWEGEKPAGWEGEKPAGWEGEKPAGWEAPVPTPAYEPGWEAPAPTPAPPPPAGEGLPIIGAVILWDNMGGGAENNVKHEYETVTKTVTVAPDAKPSMFPGEDGATVTVQPGATEVIAGPGSTHSVTVGGPGGLSFFPQELVAAVGDTIIFNFLQQNHTVTQSSFALPCEPLADGMDSGFMSNPDGGMEPAPQVAMQVMTEEPLWMYCRQGNHCGQGMVLSINPNLEKTHAQFQSAAIAAKGDNPAPAIAGGEAPPPESEAPPPPAESEAPPPPAEGDAALPTGGMGWGLGTVNPDGSCYCAVQCDMGSAVYLEGNAGMGGIGGIPGAMPWPTEPLVEPTPAPEPAPEGEPTPSPEPVPTPESWPAGVPYPEGGEPTPAPEPAAEGEPTPAPEPVPTPESWPAGVPYPEGGEPTPAPEPAVEGEPVPEPAMEGAAY